MSRTIRLHGFPSGVTAEAVVQLLEKETGKGSVYAVRLRKAKDGRRYYATVQFDTTKNAELIHRMANARNLYYGTSYLNSWKLDQDIVPKPRVSLHTFENIKLDFGCKIATNKLFSFWNMNNVSVDFGIGLRKLVCRLKYDALEYMIELSYENIWQIELHRPRGCAAKHLLIQMYGAPRISKKVIRSSGQAYEDRSLNYFMDCDDQWVRTTDFTPSRAIGQSFALSLELPHGLKLPDFRENFPGYEEIEGNLVLEVGPPYSCNPSLGPMVVPPRGVNVPYDILFKVHSLLQLGCLPGPRLDVKFYKMVDPRRIDRACIEYALDKLYNLKETCYKPSEWLNEQYMKYLTSKRRPQSSVISLDSGLVYVRRVQITPCRVFSSGPEVNVSNRVLRNYPDDIDNFIRVSFVDEEMDRVYSADLLPRTSAAYEDGKTDIYKRILFILRNGIVIGEKKFEFLAFSSSQLRENSMWMFASRQGLTAADIREWMGDFRRIKNVAKYAARLGQSFGSSTETLNVGKHEMEVIPDVENNKYVFSDGIGKISADFAKKIRYGGYKGVVAVDPTSSRKLSLRRSMSKYESENTKLDVLAAVQQLNAILTDPLKAQEALDLMSAGETTNCLKELLMCGYKPDVEPFISMMLQTFRASKLLELRTKTRIFIPDGQAMMGCLDETGTLEYGEVFVQFSGNRHPGSASNQQFIEGKVVVAKNPCLHPGDVRVLEAVNVPELHHMVDCVVFPQKGSRPHPNECSGSDLDGDIYFVCWDQELIPRRQIQPMDYTPAPSIELDHDVTMEEVEEYFVNYMVNDSLGIIANAHTVFADKDTLKAMSEPCIELAKLFSIAVDFPKTGVPAVIPAHLYVKEFPDFMEKHDKPTYQSCNVIGALFQEVKDIASHDSSIRSFTRQVAKQSYDPDMEVDGFEDYIEDAIYYKGNYDYKLGNLMDYYGIKTEAEILGGSVMRMSKSFTKRRDADSINMAVRSLRKEARAWFNEKGTGLDSGADDVYAKASAWYHVTYHPDYFGTYNEGLNRDHFISFPWCVYDKLVLIKKDKASMRRSLHMSPLERQFRSGLHLS
ncbi:RNA-dependent RNA polymerase 1 [Pyrus ussuriensis x Pyrus communis]|uniref:RNA-dependent RNA polymerase n=1 Tax=Pyrus ussuriensis x Pyrus communis TaxID=2448454 RepID=A0A5N5G1E5_9ROSA|nr:RNA-dependent RNA polymerase 1 [Pyrus ussuriensis x Pyrus communis]